jgi:hypothetical protein
VITLKLLTSVKRPALASILLAPAKSPASGGSVVEDRPEGVDAGWLDSLDCGVRLSRLPYRLRSRRNIKVVLRE